MLDQVRFVCPHERFGVVTDAELAVGIRDVTLDRVQADDEMLCISWFLIPAAIRRKISTSRVVSSSTRPAAAALAGVAAG